MPTKITTELATSGLHVLLNKLPVGMIERTAGVLVARWLSAKATNDSSRAWLEASPERATTSLFAEQIGQQVARNGLRPTPTWQQAFMSGSSRHPVMVRTVRNTAVLVAVGRDDAFDLMIDWRRLPLRAKALTWTDDRGLVEFAGTRLRVDPRHLPPELVPHGQNLVPA